MKLIIFAAGFLLLLAAVSLAAGMGITRLDARVDYGDAYVYRIEQEQSFTRKSFAITPLVDNSRIDVDVFPGSTLAFTLTLENTFAISPEIRNIVTKITIEGKHGDDLEETSTDFSLEPGYTAKADVKFYIPFEIVPGTHNVNIKVEAVGNRTSFIKQINNLKLDIKKLSHDLRITKVSLSPSMVSCSRKAMLTAEIANAGSSNEENIALQFKAQSLGLDSFDRYITLSASSDEPELMKHLKTATVEVPKFFEAGRYPITINLFWRNFIIFDQKTVDLIVKDCPVSSKKNEAALEPSNKTQESLVILPKETNKEAPIQEVITATEEFSTLNSPVFLTIFIVLIIASMFAGVVLFVKFY